MEVGSLICANPGHFVSLGENILEISQNRHRIFTKLFATQVFRRKTSHQSTHPNSIPTHLGLLEKVKVEVVGLRRWEQREGCRRAHLQEDCIVSLNVRGPKAEEKGFEGTLRMLKVLFCTSKKLKLQRYKLPKQVDSHSALNLESFHIANGPTFCAVHGNGAD